MKIIPKLRVLGVGAVALLLPLAARSQDIVLVANAGVQTSEVGEAELREVFIGARSMLHDHTRVIPVLLKGGPAHEVFLHNHVNETPESFRALWRKAVFTGQGTAPREFGSEAALLQFVAMTPGAVGYVSRVSNGFNVKVLTINKEIK